MRRRFMGSHGVVEGFEAFFAEQEPKLRRALVAACGAGRGREATVEALSWAWEHWDSVRTMDNPTGYLFRVGQSRSRDRRRSATCSFPAPVTHEPWVEPALPAGLAALSEQQRVVVVLVHGFEWTQREVADLLGISTSSVQTHLERGLHKLRAHLEVTSSA